MGGEISTGRGNEMGKLGAFQEARGCQGSRSKERRGNTGTRFTWKRGQGPWSEGLEGLVKA